MTSRETFGDRTRTHGMTNTRLYSQWCGIKSRCNNPHYKHFHRYGGRGIKVCDEWNNSFQTFLEWAISAGYDESLTGKEQSIDRIDVNGNYEPSNCRFVTQDEQKRNRGDTVYIVDGGETIPAREFARNHGIEYTFAFRRIKKGETSDVIIRDWELLCGSDDTYMSVHEASEYYHVSEQTLCKWIKGGKLKAEKHGQGWYIPKGQTAIRK